MSEPVKTCPTNLVMGFLGVGKTTAILDLLKHKPENENWAVLVNEFGKIGIDGALYAAAGVSVKEVAGGCFCCATGLPFQVGVNQLLKGVRPDRLIIEPTGLGHPKKVMDKLLSDSFRVLLDIRASICLVDPEKLKHRRYITHENFIDQIAMADLLVANKMDLADREAVDLFYAWGKQSKPPKALIAQTTQGQLDITWLDIPRNAQRQAVYPDAHAIVNPSLVDRVDHSPTHNQADGYVSFGHVFPQKACFDHQSLTRVLSLLQVERIKGILNTDKGWMSINGTETAINQKPTSALVASRIEIITRNNNWPPILHSLEQCRVS